MLYPSLNTCISVVHLWVMQHTIVLLYPTFSSTWNPYVFTFQTLCVTYCLASVSVLYLYFIFVCDCLVCLLCVASCSSVVTARLPSGDDPIEKLEKGGNTPQQSARCVLHALKAVRDGEDPASAIKNFVNQCKTTTEKTTKEVDTGNEIKKLSSDMSTIVISEDAVVPDKNDMPDTSIDAARQEEIETLKEENEKLKEAFEAMKEQHQLKIRECKTLIQERDRLSKH